MSRPLGGSPFVRRHSTPRGNGLLSSITVHREIVRLVDALFNLDDAIEARMTAATARADKLSHAILAAKAFRGELVPTEDDLACQEGRDYEPDCALLARIRADRATIEATPNPTTRTRRANARTTPTAKPARQKANSRTARFSCPPRIPDMAPIRRTR